MDALANLALGLQVAVSPENLMYCLIGVLLGTLVGVLPGIGTTASSPCCFRLPSISMPPRRSSCWPASTTGRSTAARPPSRSPLTWWRRRCRAIRRSSARARSRAWAGPEAANNAGAQASFIPMLTLGIPSNVVMALMIGAMMIQGIAPGPQVMTERPQLFWGMIVSM